MITRYAHIEAKANQMLAEWGIDFLMENPSRCLENLEIQFIKEDLDDSLSGFLMEKADNYYIFVNSGHPKTRQNFTLAHEIGHYCLHKNQLKLFIDDSDGYRLNRDFESQTGEVQMEREANAFAAVILMPNLKVQEAFDKVKSEGKTLDEIIKALSKHFKVSEHAMAIRLSNLGLDFAMF